MAFTPPHPPSHTPQARRLHCLSNHLLHTPSPNESSPFLPAPFLHLSPASGTLPSFFEHLQQAPEDPILGVTVAYNKDPSPVKLNLGVGAYRTEEGKPLVLNVVRRAEERLINDKSKNKEYLPITGIPEFNKLSAKLILGEDR